MKWTKIDTIVVGTLGLILVLVFVSGIHNNNQRDLTCKELGFESYEWINDMRYCEDTENNLHYIKMECEPWYWVKCTAKLISVGNVRVK